MLGFPVHHRLLGLAQTHVHRISDASNYLILCRPLLLLPSIFPSIRVFSRESAPRIRWPEYWNFSISISHRNYHQPQNSSSTDYLTVAVRPRTKRSVAWTAFLRGVSRGLSGAWPVSAFPALTWGLWGELAFSPTRVIDRIECHVCVGRGSLFPPAVSQSCSRLLEAAHISRHTSPPPLSPEGHQVLLELVICLPPLCHPPISSSTSLFCSKGLW